MFPQTEVRVTMMEQDFYSLQSMKSYLSWDRRTRVIGSASTPFELLRSLHQSAQVPDIILFDTSCAEGSPLRLSGWLEAAFSFSGQLQILCMARRPDPQLALAAAQVGAAGFVTHHNVGFSLAGALLRALDTEFLVTQDVAERLNGTFDGVIFRAEVLPGKRQYPALTERIEQALRLCVLKGLPAHLAAAEMGLSTNTVRSYIKEGYRILEMSDDTLYPNELSPQERAFMRYTALEATH